MNRAILRAAHVGLLLLPALLHAQQDTARWLRNAAISPDGRTIAFASDRGPETDFERLHIGNMKIATYDVATPSG